jgi:type IV pilus secretin PilQ/predicted competence protein
MIAISEAKRTQTIVARVTAIVVMAAAASIMLSATAAPVRLVGVTAEGDAVLIESTEPAAYSVSRPDPLTLVVDMRNVSVGDARSDVPKQGALAGVRLEQATAVDGRSVARVHLALVRPVEYSIRSARTTIRVELTPRPGAPTQRQAAATPAIVLPQAAVPQAPAPAPAVAADGIEKKTPGTATLLERIRTSKTTSATTITLGGNGHLTPSGVSESKDRPRRLVLDFPSVTAKTPAITAIDSQLVTRVRVGVNSVQPLVTRVVMEVAPTAKYHVQRSGDGGRDLDVVFEAGSAPAPVMLSPAEPSAPAAEPEAPVTLQQAIANAAAITPPENIADPISALNTVGRSGGEPLAVESERTAPAARSTAAAASRPTPATQPAPALKPSTPASQPALAPQSTAAAARPPAAAAFVTVPATQSAPAQAAPAPLQTRAPQAAATPPAAAQPPAQSPAPQTPAAPQPATGLRPGETRQFTGHPISMDFEGVDLRAVLRTFADVSGLNMVIDADVQGTVDIKLTDVPWDQALDVILKGNQLDYSVDGTIVRISKIKTLEDENKARVAAAQAAAERQAQAGGLTFETFPLSYAKAADTAPLLRGSLRMSKYGQVQVDVRTNTLIVADLPDQLPAIRDLLRTLDRAEPQVEVEARIVQTTRDFARAIGVQWGLNGRVMPDLGNTTGLAFPNRGTVGGRLGTQGPVDARSTELESSATAVRLGVPDASSAIGLALGAVNGAFNLDVALSALERTGKGRVLSTPRLTTQNNIEAEVAQGIQIPLQTVSNNTVTVSFKDAVLVLRVTPQITAANTVIMKITIENATADFSRQVNGIPPVDTQRANTQVQIDDGATTVIGGIFISQEQVSNEKTPLLHRIPILGWLFRNERLEDESRELLIFITPRILKG